LEPLTWRQTTYWKDSFTVFGHALIEAYRKTLELRPELYEAKERLDALLSGRIFPFAKSENQTGPLKM